MKRISPLSGELVEFPGRKQKDGKDYRALFEAETARGAELEAQLADETTRRQAAEQEAAEADAECERLETQLVSAQADCRRLEQAIQDGKDGRQKDTERIGDLRASLARSETLLEAANKALAEAKEAAATERRAREAAEKRMLDLAATPPAVPPIIPAPAGWVIKVEKDGADITRQLVLTPMEKTT